MQLIDPTRIQGLKNPRYKRIALVCVSFLAAVLVVAIAVSYLLYAPSRGFAPSTLFSVPAGMTTSALSESLKENGLIRSSVVFEKLVILFGKERGIIAGDYFFTEPVSLFEIAKRITGGVHGLVPQKVTIPEGYSIREIGELFSGKFPRFDGEEFLALARDREGYLFPDTYFFMPNIQAEHVIELLNDNFENKMVRFNADILESGMTRHEAVTLASIIEKEANGPEDRRIISGILWNRLEKKMPLQVDATLVYVTGRGSSELTSDDLKLDSPYNTYVNVGLPPTPISNPGLDSIDAALHPEESEYLFYLHDAEGKVYYAKDFEGHKRNRELYLNK